MKLEQAGMRIANAIGNVAGDKRNQQNPQRTVDGDRHEKIKAQDCQSHDNARKQERQSRQKIEQPAAAQFTADEDPGGKRRQGQRMIKNGSTSKTKEYKSSPAAAKPRHFPRLMSAGR